MIPALLASARTLMCVSSIRWEIRWPVVSRRSPFSRRPVRSPFATYLPYHRRRSPGAGVGSFRPGNNPEMLRGLIGIIWLVVGLVVASTHHYLTHLDHLKRILAAVLAVLLWPLVLVGVNLHLGSAVLFAT